MRLSTFFTQHTPFSATDTTTSPTITPLKLNVGMSLILMSYSPAWAQSQVPTLEPIVIQADRLPAFGDSIQNTQINTSRFTTNDTASLLNHIPGLSTYTGGGVSSLPAIHGLGDDRLKITVDGMSITSACPNHMNPALSYTDPANVEHMDVFAGIVPVSQGGDSIGGSIAVRSTPPEFAQPNEGFKTWGHARTFYRSNGNVQGASLNAYGATDTFSIGYSGNTVEADNYKTGNGQTVKASRYTVHNNALKLATRTSNEVYRLDLAWQNIPLQGFPNQAMDMTSNKSMSVNASYTNQTAWGELEARIFRQHVRHAMDLLPEKSTGQMPMNTNSIDLGYSLTGTLSLNDQQALRLGHEFHRYTLDDWWPTLPSGFMAPHDFWNIRDGQRDRFAFFAELDTQHTDQWSSQFGARLEQVRMNTGNVEGYHSAADGTYSGMMGPTSYLDSTYKTDADAFNAQNHERTDLNWDLTASTRYVKNANATYDLGFSRKTRSPNLHERYTWSNEAMMAGLMNNWFGDLNSYVGNINLKPEVAYTLKLSADWHDAQKQDWQLKVTPFYTHVKDYINAVPNASTNPYNMSMIMGRKSLTFANQDARLYGVDISGNKQLGKLHGTWALQAGMNYTRGKTTQGDNLYNVMPPNARLALQHTQGAWSNTLETQMVSRKKHLNGTRAEQATAGYALVNYQTQYTFNKSVQLNFGIDNLFDRKYAMPLGGLEYTTGGMMTAPQTLKGMGRSINLGLAVSF